VALQDQPPLLQGDGPIALIMAPTRELVQQIGKDVKRFGKTLGINCVCVFGGSGIANQVCCHLSTSAESSHPGICIKLLGCRASGCKTRKWLAFARAVDSDPAWRALC